MELEAVTALQLLCKQPPARKEHPRGSSAKIAPFHLTSDYQSYSGFTRIASVSFVINFPYQINLPMYLQTLLCSSQEELFFWGITELVKSNSKGQNRIS